MLILMEIEFKKRLDIGSQCATLQESERDEDGQLTEATQDSRMGNVE